VRAKSPSEKGFARLIEVADRVNYTAFQMLERLGYGREEIVSPDKPIIIIQEIGCRQNIMIGGEDVEKH
jgi:hypothetical protein